MMPILTGAAMKFTNASGRLSDIREKVDAGQRLSFDDGVFLEEHADLFTLGELANIVRERKNGNFAYYNVNDPPQSDQRLRLPLHLLRVPGRPEELQRLRHVRRADRGAGRRGRPTRGDGTAHRRRLAPPVAV